MGARTKIEWAHHTFNPWTGCARVSPGCERCYAETRSRQFPTTLGAWGPSAERRITSEAYWHQPYRWDAAAEAAGERHRVFCASMADVFEDRPELIEPRRQLWTLMAETPHLDWLVLTKRPEVAHRLVPGLVDTDPSDFPGENPLPNVWLGVSVEDQRRADERVPLLLDTPAAVRFLSCEPLLGPVDLTNISAAVGPPPTEQWDVLDREEAADAALEGGYGHIIDWVIVGGESGPRARPMDIAWARSLVEQCATAGVPAFVKQLGSRPAAARVDLTEWPTAVV
ncbi:MAG: phage Gp37/Gp68 family protein, partial [Miltoncostaeaceae bacterium]